MKNNCLAAFGRLFFRQFRILVLTLPTLVVACKQDDKTIAKYVPDNLVEETLTATDPLLKLLPPEYTGVGFQNIMKEYFEDNITTNLNKYNGGGVAIADFNQDGLQDIYFISCDDQNRLYINLGDLKFKDITEAAGLTSTEGFETAVTVVDINTDGYPDLYVCRGGAAVNEARRNKLYINNGPQPPGPQPPNPLKGEKGEKGSIVTFTDQAHLYGLDDKSASTGANFFDYDNDGDLDLYLLNHPVEGLYGTKIESRLGPDGKTREPILEPKTEFDSDRFYRNDGPPVEGGGGGFTDITKEVGVWDFAYGLSVSTTDFNCDGWTDVYVGNDFIQPDLLFINEKGKRFTNKLPEYFRHITEHTMGTDLTDFDGDGRVDLLAVDMYGANNYRQKIFQAALTQSQYSTLTQAGYYEPVVRNVLQRNNGNGTFSDVALLGGTAQTDWSWSGLLADYDNDGLRDISVSNGYRREITDRDFLQFTMSGLRANGVAPRLIYPNFDDFLNLLPTYKPRNFIFRNKGDWQFEDVSGQWITVPATWSLGSAWADLDNDGDLDLVVNNLESPAFIYQNMAREQGKGNFLQIKVHGSAQNPMAVGASAAIYYGGTVQYLELFPTRGIFSSVEHLLHFGLGNTTTVDKVVVRWPDGKTQTLTNVPANQRLELHYADASGYTPHIGPAPAKPQYFAPATAAQASLDWKHEEDAFNDFETWQLNFWTLSDLGPLVAQGDVNGDGLDDVFVGNTFDKPAALFVQTRDGRFQASNAPLWNQEKIYEDHDAVFFDADGDGDQDLYVVSGGAEAVSDLAWQDRLYLNDGKGNFSRDAAALPVIKDVGLRVRAFDYDRDGDLDIFVGGRVAGAQWPLAPRSVILQNDGRGKFTDVTSQVAPSFEHCGMVTDLQFADLDADGTAELVVCGEWMPVSVFQFSGGKYVNATEKFGLIQSNGLWNCLVVADLDGDGDPDLVSGNLGLNTRLHAAADAPLRVYAADFDNNGQLDPIVTFDEDGKTWPLVQRDVLVKQMPVLKKKFLYARNYAHATINDVLDDQQIKSALVLSAYSLETCWWENQGGRFIRHKLPNPAQTAPVQAILAADFTGDGRIDLLLAGNKYGMEVETNRCDAGNGVLLQGDGKGNFAFVENAASGFWATRDVRDIALLHGAGGRRMVLVTNNQDKLQVYKVEK